MVPVPAKAHARDGLFASAGRLGQGAVTSSLPETCGRIAVVS